MSASAPLLFSLRPAPSAPNPHSTYARTHPWWVCEPLTAQSVSSPETAPKGPLIHFLFRRAATRPRVCGLPALLSSLYSACAHARRTALPVSLHRLSSTPFSPKPWAMVPLHPPFRALSRPAPPRSTTCPWDVLWGSIQSTVDGAPVDGAPGLRALPAAVVKRAGVWSEWRERGMAFACVWTDGREWKERGWNGGRVRFCPLLSFSRFPSHSLPAGSTSPTLHHPRSCAGRSPAFCPRSPTPLPRRPHPGFSPRPRRRRPRPSLLFRQCGPACRPARPPPPRPPRPAAAWLAWAAP